MIELLQQCEEFVPSQWREGLIVNRFRRGITLLSVVGNVFCMVDWWSIWTEVKYCMKGQSLRVKRSCIDQVRVKKGKGRMRLFWMYRKLMIQCGVMGSG